MMNSRRFIRRMKTGTLTALLAGGTLFGWNCTQADLQKNIVAGSLAYVKGSTTTFWNTYIPPDRIWGNLFTPLPGFTAPE